MPSALKSVPVLAKLNDWTWLHLPARVGAWSVGWSGVLLDGLYVSAWPLVGAAILPLVLWLGLYMGSAQAVGGVLYIYSFAAMTVLVLVSQHGAVIGLTLWLGFVAGDLLSALPAATWTTGFFAARLLADLVLGSLLVAVPLVARALSRSSIAMLSPFLESAGAQPRGQRVALGASCHALMEFALVYLWVQAAGLLLQPFYVWQGAGPMTHGLVVSLRDLGWPLAMVAAYVGGVRVGLEFAAAAEPTLLARRRRLRELQTQNPWRYRPAYGLALVPLRAGVLTLLMSGLIDNAWGRGVTVFLATAVILLLREIAFGYFGLRLDMFARIPVVLRVLGAFAIAYVLSSYIVRSFGGGTFVDGLTAAVVSLAVFAVVAPAPPRMMLGRAAKAGTGR
jgi:hypothetical protein